MKKSNFSIYKLFPAPFRPVRKNPFAVDQKFARSPRSSFFFLPFTNIISGNDNSSHLRQGKSSFIKIIIETQLFSLLYRKLIQKGDDGRWKGMGKKRNEKSYEGKKCLLRLIGRWGPIALRNKKKKEEPFARTLLPSFRFRERAGTDHKMGNSCSLYVKLDLTLLICFLSSNRDVKQERERNSLTFRLCWQGAKIGLNALTTFPLIPFNLNIFPRRLFRFIFFCNMKNVWPREKKIRKSRLWLLKFY